MSLGICFRLTQGNVGVIGAYMDPSCAVTAFAFAARPKIQERLSSKNGPSPRCHVRRGWHVQAGFPSDTSQASPHEQGGYGASISSIFPSRVRCKTITLPLGSRKTNTSRSRKWASLMASSSVMGRMATASSERTKWTSVDLATAGNLCTTTGTLVASASPTAVWSFSWAPLPFHFLCSWRFLLRQRVLYLTACFSRCSSASLTAAVMSPACARPTRVPLRGLMVISALWRCFSTARITLVSNLSPRILRIFARPVSTDLRMAGLTSYCLPVYSTFMSALLGCLLPRPGHRYKEARVALYCHRAERD